VGVVAIAAANVVVVIVSLGLASALRSLSSLLYGKLMHGSDGFESKIFSIRVGSGLWIKLGFGKFPLKPPNFPILFPSDKKNLTRSSLH